MKKSEQKDGHSHGILQTSSTKFRFRDFLPLLEACNKCILYVLKKKDNLLNGCSPKEVKQEDRKPEADIGIGNHMYSTTKGDRSLGGLLKI